MLLTIKQSADLHRAIAVYDEIWAGDTLQVTELDTVLEALEEIIAGKIDYNQFIYRTGIVELKNLLLM